MNVRKLLPNLTKIDRKILLFSVGDSKMAGTSSVGHVAPVPTLGTMKEYNRTTGLFQDVTGEVLYISGNGSQWPRFGINYNALTNKTVYFVNSGAASSTFYSPTDTHTWDPAANSLYQFYKVYWDDAIIKSGISRPIFAIGLGVNDQALNDDYIPETLEAATRLIEQINSDYNNPTIYINLFSRQPTSGHPLNILIKSFETTYSNVSCSINEGAILANGATVEGTHYNAVGNNRYGEMFANYVASTESDKDIRRLQNSNFYTDISTAYKAAYSTFVTSAKSNGYWDSLAALFVFRSEVAANYLSNILGYGAGANSGAVTFTANDRIGTNGVNSAFSTQFAPSVYEDFGITINDIFIGVKTGNVANPAGVNAGLFGAVAGGIIYLQKASGGPIRYAVNGNFTVDTDTSFSADTHYAIQRDGVNSDKMWKAGAIKKTSTNVSVAIPTDGISFGQSFANAKLEAEGFYLFCAKSTGFNYPAFLTDIDIFLNAVA